MRLSPFALLTLVVLTSTGCGTIHNLRDRPQGLVFLTEGACYPFGGVTRSGALALCGPTFGVTTMAASSYGILTGEPEKGFESMLGGMTLTAAGLGAIIDTPFSLVGDIVTYPIAYARSKEYPWACWWGKESMVVSPREPAEPTPETGDKPSEDQSKPADGETKPSEDTPKPTVTLPKESG